MKTTRPGQSALLLPDVIALLHKHGVDYLVIGAFALAVHGTVRGSMDVDALLRVDPARLPGLRDDFVDAGFAVALREGGDDDPIPNLLAITDPHGNRVHLLGGLRGLDPLAFKRGIDVPFRGETLRVVGREDFIAMKCFAGSAQDILDAQSAYRGAQGPVDVDLVRRLTRRFGRDAAERLEQVLC